MTDDEKALAELAVRKQDLNDELQEVRKQLRAKAKNVELPLIVALNGRAVHINKPLGYSNGLPQCTVARCVHD